MSRIKAHNVHKYFHYQHQRTLKELVDAIVRRNKTIEYVHALDNVSFEIDKGESVGIIGINGAGKSTLLSLIAGVSTPSSGTLRVNGSIAPLISLGAGFHPDLTGRENIFLNGVILGLDEKYIEKHLQDIIDFSELDEKFIHTPVKYYSSGMYMRLGFSVAVFTNPEILLVDEILAVGDDAFRKKCYAKLHEFKKQDVTIVLVSHDLSKVEDFCSRVIYLKKGAVAFDGDVKEGLKMYRNDMNISHS